MNDILEAALKLESDLNAAECDAETLRDDLECLWDATSGLFGARKKLASGEEECCHKLAACLQRIKCHPKCEAGKLALGNGTIIADLGSLFSDVAPYLPQIVQAIASIVALFGPVS